MLKDKAIGMTKAEKQRKENTGGGNIQNIQELRYKDKRYDIHSTGTPEEEREGKQQDLRQ